MRIEFRAALIRAGAFFGLVALMGTASSVGAASFDSGSTGADGALKPNANVELIMPANGIFNYTNIEIPVGVTVTFRKNAANTPVVLLASGPVKIAGVINVSGGNSAAVTVGSPFVTDGGPAGPGGYQGGRGSLPASGTLGGTGHGPGGGQGGTLSSCNGNGEGGGGAGFGTVGAASYCMSYYNYAGATGKGGAVYGSASTAPLIGGAGGGGGGGNPKFTGSGGTGGGGGGGALLLVSSGPVELSGSILATGGASGAMVNAAGACDGSSFRGGMGGGGAGGAVRILAPAFFGTGKINVDGGTAGGAKCNAMVISGGDGGYGRSSVEIVSSGKFTFSDIPTLSILSIADVTVTAPDVALPLDLPSQARVVIKASGVPPGTVATLTLALPYGPNLTASSTPLTGTSSASTASADIAIPYGQSTLSASVSYSLTVAQGEALSTYAQGERVEKVELAAKLGDGASKVTLITVSGKTYEVPAAVLAMKPA